MQKLVSKAISQGRDTVEPATLATQIHGVTGQVIWLSYLFPIGPKAQTSGSSVMIIVKSVSLAPAGKPRGASQTSRSPHHGPCSRFNTGRTAGRHENPQVKRPMAHLLPEV